jgi:3-oxoacyl-[acyl-carrier-protein] synthase II
VPASEVNEPLAITGTGAVTPLGVGAEALFERWRAGCCGLRDGVGSCDEFDVTEVMSTKEERRTDRFTQLLVAAADEAVGQAGWAGGLPYRADRVACIVGTGIGGILTMEDQLRLLGEQGKRRVSPLAVPNMMPNAAAAAVAIRYGAEGECFCTAAACAASAHAIGVGVGLLRSGRSDAVLVGGTEAALSSLTEAAFANMGATSPSGRSRPFDRRRDGFVLSEGAGVMILERLGAARERRAEVIGELLGYGASCDAFHLTAPQADGVGAAAAMTRALEDAGVEPDGLDYINAHGTSTPLNDRSETLAIKRVLGETAYRVPVSSTKSAIGHLLGACGTVEAVATVLSLRHDCAPPTLGYAEPEEGLDLDYVPDGAREIGNGGSRPLVGLSNTFGFGGHNAAVVLRA